MNINLGIFEIFIGRVTYDDGSSSYEFNVYNIDWLLFIFIMILLIVCSYALGVYLGGYNMNIKYNKLVDKYNRYVEISQRKSVAWSIDDDISPREGYRAEVVHVYSKDNYRKLQQYGELLTYSIETNYIKESKITKDRFDKLQRN